VKIWVDYRVTSKQLTISEKSLIWNPVTMIQQFLVKSPVSLYNGITTGRMFRPTDEIKLPVGFPLSFTYRLVSSVSRTLCKLIETYSFDTFTRSKGASLPIAETAVNKFVGYLPFQVGSARTKVQSSDENFDEFIQKEYLYLNECWNDIYSDSLLLGGGIDSILPNLRTMATPSVSTFTYDEMLEAIDKRKHHLDLPTIPEPKESWIDSVKINVSAFPGFFSSLFYGKTKYETSEASTLVAKSLFKRITEGRTHALELWKFGSRPKLVGLDEDNKTLRARPIAMCDDVLNKVCSTVSQPITESLIRSPLSELFIGRRLGYDEVRWIESHIQRDDCLCASPDWSQFDNHVYEELIVTAFSLIRQMLPGGWKMNNLIYYICSSVVDKFVVVDPGLVFKIMKGLPSGHPFTTLIGTVINWILWSTIFNNYCKIKGIPLTDEFRVVCSGDDTLVRVPKDIDVVQFQLCIDRSGMKSKPFSSTLGLFNTTNGRDGACFLRRRFLSDGHICWDYLYLIEKLRFPDLKDRKDLYSLMERTSDYIKMGPGYSPSTTVLQKYIDFLSNKYFKGDTINSKPIWNELQQDKHLLATTSYFSDTGFNGPRKEGWELERSSKMKIVVTSAQVDKEYFSTGVKRFNKSLWDKINPNTLMIMADKSKLNLGTRFRTIDELIECKNK
jgi:hypothetical protein